MALASFDSSVGWTAKTPRLPRPRRWTDGAFALVIGAASFDVDQLI